jgi:hypothetical protein
MIAAVAVSVRESTGREYLDGRFPTLAQRKLLMRSRDYVTAIQIWCCPVANAAQKTFEYGTLSAHMAFLAFPDLREVSRGA